MRITHPDYIKLVYGTYQHLRTLPGFSPALKQPTPAAVRSECLTVYQERPGKKDDPTLRAFFGPAENNSFLGPIDNFPTQKFKAFTNYLHGKALNTDDKNVELLAWLIDFPHRPFRLGMDIILSEEEKKILNGRADKNTAPAPIISEQEPPPIIPQENSGELERKDSGPLEKGEKEEERKKIWPWKKMIAAVFILALGGTGIYWIITQVIGEKKEQCAYWNGTFYEKVPCKKTNIDSTINLAQRKIEKPDTITARSIGKIFYIKTNKSLEYFTHPGVYPTNPDRHLKPISAHIFNTYLDSNKAELVDTPAKR